MGLFWTRICIFRVAFEKDGLTAALERLAGLEMVLTTEEANQAKYERQKTTLKEEIVAAEEAIGNLRTELAEIQEVLEEKTKDVETVKKTTAKAGKVLDIALKEIATWVCFVSFVP